MQTLVREKSRGKSSTVQSTGDQFPSDKFSSQNFIFAMPTLYQKDELAPWNDILQNKLIKWRLDPDWFSGEEDFVAPSVRSIATAISLVTHMHENHWSLPTGVIPDGEGGIVFENRIDPVYERIEIEEDGALYCVSFVDCVLQSRYRVEIE